MRCAYARVPRNNGDKGAIHPWETSGRVLLIIRVQSTIAIVSHRHHFPFSFSGEKIRARQNSAARNEITIHTNIFLRYT